MCIKKIAKIFQFLFIIILVVLAFNKTVFALDGVINPKNNPSKFYKAQIMADDSVINMGWYGGGATVSGNIPVVVGDSELTGFAFSENYGWINLNCANTTTAFPLGICGTSDFKVSNTDGVLSGYAWGENLGWINFGPPAPGRTYPYVIINTGVSSELVGYAWSENLGWILFDCTESHDSCTTTDWGTDCNDGIDNDDDGFIDYGSDPECLGTYDNSEGEYQCNDGVDNDGDGYIDYPDDPQCSSSEDNKEAAGSSSSTSGQSSGISASTSDPSQIDNQGDEPVVDNTPPDSTPITNQNNSNSENHSGGGNDETDGSIIPTSNPPEEIYIPEEAFTEIEDKNTDNVKDKIIDIANELLDSEKKVKLANTISGAGAALAVGTTLPTLITIINIGEIGLVPIRLASLFLSALGIRRKKWGVVYDSVTKQPLDPVYVVLRDMDGNVVATSITDLDGRYAFLVKKGKYIIEANKSNYEFPTKDLIGKSSDGVYNDLYYGQIIDIPEDGATLTYNIPLAPIAFDWNEVAKRKQKVMKFYTRRRKNFIAITRILYYFGFIISLFVAVVQPKPYTFIILGFYVLVFILHRIGIKERAHGTVVDKYTGYGLPYSVIEVYSQNTGVKVKNCVSDETGKYLCLLGNGIYKLVVQRKAPDGSYEKVLEKENVVVKNGVLSDNIEL